jgi:hypothetical protein
LGGELEDEESSWGESEGFSVGVGDDIDEDFFGRSCRSLLVEEGADMENT